MASLKEVRNRIVSVNSTQQITKAMKMVSAAKLRKAQNRITQMRPYAEKLDEILSSVSGMANEDVRSPFAKVRPLKHLVIVTVTSDKGLCGPFNNNICKSSLKYIQDLTRNQDVKITIMPIGKKGLDFYKKQGFTIDDRFSKIFENLDFENSSIAASDLMNQFLDHKVDEVRVFYNQFKNAATQNIMNEQLLPLKQPEGNTTGQSEYIYEPSVEYIMDELIPNSLRIKLFKALLDSNASEHGARMTAMTQATDNAGELLKELKLTYNRTRQAAITKEILEIVGGAEALSN